MEFGADNQKVWIENHPEWAYAPGQVEETLEDGTLVLIDAKGDKFKADPQKAESVDPACLTGVDDLLQLGDFNEAALLHNVRVRYDESKIYTSIGAPILISLNPYQNLTELYSTSRQKEYREDGAAQASGQPSVLPPHLYSVADSAYRTVLNERQNQSIIISGESGAGKTEATKRILAFLAAMQQDLNSGNGERTVERQVLDANPVLEAFGNAKTVRNDNSSRFGKFIEVEFDGGGRLVSAQIQNYLLEKCRIITQQPNERNYHVFYQLCAGVGSMPELAAKLQLSRAEEYEYISTCRQIEGTNDSKEFEEMLECMTGLGFTDEDREAVFRIVASVLHLGNLQFSTVAIEGGEGVGISDTTQAMLICQLLGVELEALQTVLEHKTLQDPLTKKVIYRPHNLSSADFTRHAIAKVLYARLFDWLVWKINLGISGDKAKKDTHHIGLLDIFGFEVFECNSFEQLCINFANEKLQQHFNNHMFTQEQQLYTKEGITWSHIQWQDNAHIIEALEKKPLGVFCLVDSECTMPSATDESLLAKVHNTFKSSNVVFKPSKFKSCDFAVAHYAGDVVYNVETFLMKNKDSLHVDILNLLKDSQLDLVKTLFTDSRFSPDQKQEKPKAGAKPKAMRRGSSQQLDNSRGKQNVTVSMMFREQLKRLVEDLRETNPRFIRCMKPNVEKAKNLFDSGEVLRQLRCAGMLEAIRIRRAGYGVRRTFEDFWCRFRPLAPSLKLPTGAKADQASCKKLLEAIVHKLEQKQCAVQQKSFQVGLTRVFMKDDLEKNIEWLLAQLRRSFAVMIQKRWRGSSQRKRFQALRKAALLAQAASRTFLAVHAYRILKRRHDAAKQCQAVLRTSVVRLDFSKKRRAVIHIQRIFRGHRIRSRIGEIKSKKGQEKLRKMREGEAEKEKARVRNEQIEAERLESERENEALRQQLQEAQEAKSAQVEAEKAEKERQEVEALWQKIEDMQHNHSMEVSGLQQKKQSAESREKALQDKIAELEEDNQRLQSRMEPMRPSEMDRTLQELQAGLSPRGRPSRAKQSEALSSLGRELMPRLGLAAPNADNHALRSALVPDNGVDSLSQTTSKLEDTARRSIVGQRDMFEKLKIQFSQVESNKTLAEEVSQNHDDGRQNERVEELERMNRDLRSEVAKQKTKLLQLEVEKEEYTEERETLLKESSRLKAEALEMQSDLTILKEEKHSAERRYADLLVSAKAPLASAEAQVTELQEEVSAVKESASAELSAVKKEAAEVQTRAAAEVAAVQEEAAELRRQAEAELVAAQEEATEKLSTIRQEAETAKEEAAAQLAALRAEAEEAQKEAEAKIWAMQEEVSAAKESASAELSAVKEAAAEAQTRFAAELSAVQEEASSAKAEMAAELATAHEQRKQAAEASATVEAQIQDIQSAVAKDKKKSDEALKLAVAQNKDLQTQLEKAQSSCDFFQKKHKELKTATATALDRAKEAEVLRAEVAKLQRRLGESQGIDISTQYTKDQAVEVFRSNGSWTPGIILSVSAEKITVGLEDRQQLHKDIPIARAWHDIRLPQTVQSPQRVQPNQRPPTGERRHNTPKTKLLKCSEAVDPELQAR